jgi:hypothetical protein
MTMVVPPARADKPPARSYGNGFDRHTGNVTDEIAGGAGGPLRLRSRAALVLVAAVLFGYAVTHRVAPVHPPAVASTPPVSVQQFVSPVPRADLSGRVRAGPAGLRVLVDGTDPRIVDAHSLTVTPVPGLRLASGQAADLVQLGPAGIAALVSLPGPTGGIYLIRPGEPALLLGGGSMVVPGRDGSLVVAAYRPGGTTVTGLALNSQVRWQWSMPGKVNPLRDTPAGLVVARYADAVVGDGEFLLLDRQTGSVRRRLGHGRYPLATDDQSMAWVPTRCVPDCAVIRTELATGAARRYRMPTGREPAAGAFAPGGRQLAVSFSGAPPNHRLPTRPGFVGILDLRTAALTRMPGLATPAAEHADVTWSSDGGWLVLGVRWPEEELIAIWRPGADVTILPLALPGEPATARLTALR